MSKIYITGTKRCCVNEAEHYSCIPVSWSPGLPGFWFDQEIKYNWKADIHTGSRSQVDVILN